MAIALAISGKPLLEVDAESITIGSDPAGVVTFSGDERIKPRHAVIRRVAGRWLVEVREAESIQVGDSEPARVHWLNAGDVIRLVENGPEITFQPPIASAPAPAARSAPAPPISPPVQIRPLEIKSPVPQHDSLFEPRLAPDPPARPSPPRRATAPRAPEPQIRRDGETHSNRIAPRKNVDDDDVEADYIPVAEAPSGRALPKLRNRDADFSETSATSQTTIGWIMIWMAVGLGLLAVVACIWFGSRPVSV